MELPFPPESRIRVIVNSDAKTEADDQYAIVHALLTPSFDVHGIIPAHFGSDGSQRASRDEVDLLLRLMHRAGTVRVADGAPRALPDDATPIPSPGAALIVDEAMRDDDRPLHVAFMGPLTDMASAILMEPRIQDRNVRVVWIGGYAWPDGGTEYNLDNDIHAANVVMRSRVEVWQIPRPVYRLMSVGFAELLERVYPMGELGRYLVEQLVEFTVSRIPVATEHRCLGDSPAVGVIMRPDCGWFSMRPAPEFDDQMRYVHTGKHRDIRVYETIDTRFIMEDFFVKLKRFHRDGGTVPPEIAALVDPNLAGE